jgi:hypothetical protein
MLQNNKANNIHRFIRVLLLLLFLLLLLIVRMYNEHRDHHLCAYLVYRAVCVCVCVFVIANMLDKNISRMKISID